MSCMILYIRGCYLVFSCRCVARVGVRRRSRVDIEPTLNVAIDGDVGVVERGLQGEIPARKPRGGAFGVPIEYDDVRWRERASDGARVRVVRAG
mmetsp:Transcript_6457/g.21783  ORF Transcript_6457/g.21783 Transcript_6457/m.21783 type:complete len:94 (+) Transcript_6457:1335-1616(+)